ncbi:hypothetical protein [Neobacillus sp. NPDC093127]|uniref:hypothetical protein n=1 Tax=Neobacillus sp. NPDC093127 TaxID=3364296 RepID=UPI003816941F
MSSKDILESLELLLKETQITGEKLNGSLIARKIGCSRTTLYTNPKVRELLIQSGLIDESQVINKKIDQSKIKEEHSNSLNRKLKRLEDKASRLEMLLSEANEKNRVLEEELRRQRFQNKLLMEGNPLL